MNTAKSIVRSNFEIVENTLRVLAQHFEIIKKTNPNARMSVTLHNGAWTGKGVKG